MLARTESLIRGQRYPVVGALHSPITTAQMHVRVAGARNANELQNRSVKPEQRRRRSSHSQADRCQVLIISLAPFPE